MTMAFCSPPALMPRAAKGAFCPTHATRLLRKRPRIATRTARPRHGAAAARATFFWANDALFGDDERSAREDDEDGDDGEDDGDDDEVHDLQASAEGAEHPVFGRTWAYAAGAGAGAGASGDDVGEANESTSVEAKGILDALAKLTKSPEDLDQLRAATSEDAIDAFRRVVIGIFGSVPGDAFEVIVNTDKTGITRLMQSALATGYSLRNAEWLMALQAALAPDTAPAAPLEAAGGDSEPSPAAAGATPPAGGACTSEASGDVQWWDAEADERRRMRVADYIAKIEAENALLKARLEAAGAHSKEHNRLLGYMRTLRPEKVAELQAMGEHSLAAFKAVVRRILGTAPADKMQITFSTSRDYIGQLAFWCLLVGYHVRALEKKADMAKLFQQAPEEAELPAQAPCSTTDGSAS